MVKSIDLKLTFSKKKSAIFSLGRFDVLLQFVKATQIGGSTRIAILILDRRRAFKRETFCKKNTLKYGQEKKVCQILF